MPVNAMTLTPSRAVAIFSRQELDRHGHPRREALPWWIFAVLGGLLSVWLAKRLWAAELGLGSGQEHGEGLSWAAYLGLMLPGALLGGALGRFITLPVNAVLSWIFGGFNRLFDRLTDAYGRGVARLVRGSVLVLAVYGGLLAMTGWTMSVAPKGFIPVQDQGYLLVNAQLPDAASVG